MNLMYMKTISAIFAALIFTVAYYGLIPLINKVWSLDIEYNDNKLKDKFVWIIGTLSTIIVGFVVYLHFTDMVWPLLVMTLLLLISLALITVSDYKKQLVPNKIIVILLCAWSLIMVIYVITMMEFGIKLLLNSLLGGLVAGLTFLLCYILSKKQLGAGDVKVAFIMGLYLTSSRVVAGLFYGVFICSIFSIVQLCRKKMNFKSGLPLVPFLYLGTVIAYILL